jgi:hypothetical protein
LGLQDIAKIEISSMFWQTSKEFGKEKAAETVIGHDAGKPDVCTVNLSKYQHHEFFEKD